MVSVICTSSKRPIKELYFAGCANGYIGRVDYNSGEILWKKSAPAPEDCNDIEFTKKGVLYAYSDGARLVKESGEIIWDYKAPKGAELYTATTTKKGYMLAMCGKPLSIIVLLDKNGVVTKEIKFNTGSESIHGQLRQVIATDHDTFLVPVMSRGYLIEVNHLGKIVKKIKVGGNPFSVHKTNNKDEYMVSCGDDGKIVFVNLYDGMVRRQITNDDIVGDVKMLFVAELKMLKNGNILIANWNGHSVNKTEPLIFEIDSDNRVVSKMNNSGNISKISAFHLLD